MKIYKRLLIFTATLLAVCCLFGLWIYTSKAYYPVLPYENGSKKAAVEKLSNSDNELVELAHVNGFYWLGFKGNSLDGRNKIITEMEERGLTYSYYEGAGIFFENGDRVVITGKMWTGKYILYKIPEESYIGKEDK